MAHQAHPRSGVLDLQEDGYRAFIPNLLPPMPPLDLARLEPMLSATNVAVGRLDGLSAYVPNVEWFVAMYVRKEAVLSTQIEGTQASLSDLLEYEAGEPDGRGEKSLDVQEVVNYVRAVNDGLEMLTSSRLDTSLLSAVHRTLMDGVRGENRAPGVVRKTQNWISRGGQTGTFNTVHDAVFVPPPPDKLPSLLNNLDAYLNSGDTPAIVQAGIAHAQFETIHPYLDGNGRLGRLMISLLLAQRGVLRKPLLYLSAYLAQRKGEYYEQLMRVRTDGDWEGWISFYLEGVRRVADEACETVRRVNTLREQYRAKVVAHYPGKQSTYRLLEHLFRYPIIRAKIVAGELALDLTTVNGAIGELIAIGVLEETTGKRKNRVYRYAAYLKALDA